MMVRLTKREQQFAIILTALILVSTVYGLAIRPARQRIATLERIFPEKEQELGQVETQSREYLALRREFAAAQSREAQQDPNFELPSFLESAIDLARGGEVEQALLRLLDLRCRLQLDVEAARVEQDIVAARRVLAP